ncbi:MAG: hypothetical protein IJJ15_09655 [Ruminococcus sp.]|nr:hypothetical protein [Ruminococcus sp.]
MRKLIFQKITVALILCVLLLSLSVYASAASASLSLDVNGTLKAGKTFQVAISSDTPLYAVQLDIEYDTSRIEFKGVKSGSDAAVRSRRTQDHISVILSGSKTTSGTLMTCTFKALSDGESKIVFSPMSAVDSAEKLIDFDKALTLNFTAGDNASFSTDLTPKKESPSPTTAQRPLLDSRSSGDESRSHEITDEFRSKPPILRYVLIALSVALLAAAALVIGIRIGKRSKKKTQSDPNETESPDNDKKAEP